MITEVFGDMKVLAEVPGTTSGKNLIVECQVCQHERVVNKYTFTNGRGWMHDSCVLHQRTEANKRANLPAGQLQQLRALYGNIVQRCNQPNHVEYARYGGRGIQVEWKDFQEFFEAMGETFKPGLSVERIDNNGNYTTKNCKWATSKEQSRNRRSNRPVEVENTKTREIAYFNTVVEFFEYIQDDSKYKTGAYGVIDNPKRSYKGWRLRTWANGEGS